MGYCKCKKEPGSIVHVKDASDPVCPDCNQRMVPRVMDKPYEGRPNLELFTKHPDYLLGKVDNLKSDAVYSIKSLAEWALHIESKLEQATALLKDYEWMRCNGEIPVCIECNDEENTHVKDCKLKAFLGV